MNEILTRDTVKQIIADVFGVSAMMFIMAYLESNTIAYGIFWKIVRRLGIAGIGWAVMSVVSENMKDWVDGIYVESRTFVEYRSGFDK